MKEEIKQALKELKLGVEVDSARYGSGGTIRITLRLGDELITEACIDDWDIREIKADADYY